MNAYRQLERVIFQCPEIDCKDYVEYPSVNDAMLCAMENEVLYNTEICHAFFYIGESPSGENYINVYIWDPLFYPDSYKRLVIREGYRMTPENEDVYLYYVELAHQGKLRSYWKHFENFTKLCTKDFDGWKYRNYQVYEMDLAMAHLYFASHRSGCREMLFKAGLCRIAYNIENIPDVNMMASAPEKIFGEKIPLRLLRILNRESFIDKIYSAESLLVCREVYKQYSGYFSGTHISIVQWNYLEELYHNNGVFSGEGFNRALFRKLEDAFDLEFFQYYKEFQELRSEILENVSCKWLIKSLKLPRPDEVEEVLYQLKEMQRLLAESVGLEKDIALRGKLSMLNYIGERYTVIVPKSVAEICGEAIAQGSCLMDYIERQANGKTSVAFLRKNNDINQSYVTFEVVNRRITQVRARYNSFADVEAYEFLEEYANTIGIDFDPVEILTEDEKWEDAEVDERLIEYVENYGLRLEKRENTGESDYHQLAFESFFSSMKDENWCREVIVC